MTDYRFKLSDISGSPSLGSDRGSASGGDNESELRSVLHQQGLAIEKIRRRLDEQNLGVANADVAYTSGEVGQVPGGGFNWTRAILIFAIVISLGYIFADNTGLLDPVDDGKPDVEELRGEDDESDDHQGDEQQQPAKNRIYDLDRAYAHARADVFDEAAKADFASYVAMLEFLEKNLSEAEQRVYAPYVAELDKLDVPDWDADAAKRFMEKRAKESRW